VKNQFFQPRIYARRGEKHYADRYCAANILMLLGPVGGCETFGEFISFARSKNAA
jgi:hypothetical protein